MKVLSICGSPRKGNSESILQRIRELLKKEGIDNEIILLRNKKINQCNGCVEYCNKNLKCHINDDMPDIMDKMLKADAIILISPNYFKMPTGLFKNFIDRCSIFYTAGYEEKFKDKKIAVIAVGTDTRSAINVCLNNIANNFCKTLGMNVVWKKSFRSHSEINQNCDDVFDPSLNRTITEDLNTMIKSICSK